MDYVKMLLQFKFTYKFGCSIYPGMCILNFVAESFGNNINCVAHTHEPLLNWRINNLAKQYFLYIIHRL